MALGPLREVQSLSVSSRNDHSYLCRSGKSFGTYAGGLQGIGGWPWRRCKDPSKKSRWFKRAVMTWIYSKTDVSSIKSMLDISRGCHKIFHLGVFVHGGYRRVLTGKATLQLQDTKCLDRHDE